MHAKSANFGGRYAKSIQNVPTIRRTALGPRLPPDLATGRREWRMVTGGLFLAAGATGSANVSAQASAIVRLVVFFMTRHNQPRIQDGICLHRWRLPSRTSEC